MTGGICGENNGHFRIPEWFLHIKISCGAVAVGFLNEYAYLCEDVITKIVEYYA